jgi:anaerobic selenocysteine-containing dehydrogenase
METRRVPTFCRVCEPACGLVATVEDGRVTELEPDRDHPLTQGFACTKGIAALDVHRDPDRLNHPWRRDGSDFVRTSWDEALDGIAGRVRSILEEHGPEAIGAYVGNPSAFNSLVDPALGAFLKQLGVTRVFSSGTQDCANKFAGSEAMFGSSTIHPIPDIDHTDYLLLLGTNPVVSHMSFISIANPMKVLRGVRRRGGRVVFVNPRRIESARPDVGELVLIRPDTDVYLLAALLCEIERTGGFREDVLRDNARNVDGLRAFVRRYPPDRVAPVTGIDAETIRAMARDFAGAPSAAIHVSTGVNMGRQGTLAYWLAFMLSLVTGNLDRRGGNVLSQGFYPSAPRAGRVRGDDPFFPSRHGKVRRIRGTLPGNLMADDILDPERPIRAFFVLAGNPLLSVAGEERLRKAFSSLECLVVIDLYRTASGEVADYLLPATDMLERPDLNITGLGLQHRPYVQFTDRVVQPTAERREEWWILSSLARRLGYRSMLDETPTPNPFARLDHMLAGSGLSVEALRSEPRGRFLAPLEPGRFFSDQVQTADRRVDCHPEIFADAVGRAEEIFEELLREPPGRLKLIQRRDAFMHNSWYQNVERLKLGDHDRNHLYIHPEDAAVRGVAEGDRVRVHNEHGAVEVDVRLDDALMAGVVAMTHGWGNGRTPGMRVARRHPGVNVNVLLPSGPGSYETVSNQAHMTGIAVEVAPTT